MRLLALIINKIKCANKTILNTPTEKPLLSNMLTVGKYKNNNFCTKLFLKNEIEQTKTNTAQFIIFNLVLCIYIHLCL